MARRALIGTHRAQLWHLGGAFGGGQRAAPRKAAAIGIGVDRACGRALQPLGFEPAPCRVGTARNQGAGSRLIFYLSVKQKMPILGTHNVSFNYEKSSEHKNFNYYDIGFNI